MQPAPSDRLLAVLLVVPAALVLGPWHVLAEYDPLPLATIAGVALLASLPAAVALVVAGERPRVPDFALVVVALVAALLPHGREITDTFERDRVALTLVVFATAFLGGASLARAGRTWFGRALLVVSLLGTLPPLVALGLGFDRDVALAGALGNTGTLAHVVMPGAGAGLFLAASRAKPLLRWLGGLAFACALVHAALAPVITALVAYWVLAALLVVRALALLGAVARTSAPDGTPVAAEVSLRGVGMALVALALATAPFAGPLVDALNAVGSRTVPPAVLPAPGGDGAGLTVRFALWGASAGLVADYPLAGVGAGQFAARFPPYRSAEERELARASAVTRETEVEHPHNEFLAAFAEGGLFMGLAWLALLGLGIAAALRAAMVEARERAALGFAILPLGIAALVHLPHLANSAAAVLGGALLGALLAREGGPPPRPLGALRPWAALLLVGAMVPTALSFARHGLDLAARQEALVRAAEGAGDEALERAHVALGAALAARGDSPLALGLTARTALARGDVARARESNDRLLAVRPHQLEARVRAGLIAVRSGDHVAARAAWRAALDIEPEHEIARANLARLELEHLEPEAAAMWIIGDGVPIPRALDLVSEAQRGGWAPPEVLVRALADVPPFTHKPSPEALFAHARALGEADSESESARAVAAGLESLAHHLFAHDHRARGDVGSERRSLRQAWNSSRRGDAPGSPLVALELAAAEAELGDRARAAEVLAVTPPTPRARRWLAPERAAVLVDAGLLAD